VRCKYSYEFRIVSNYDWELGTEDWANLRKESGLLPNLGAEVQELGAGYIPNPQFPILSAPSCFKKRNYITFLLMEVLKSDLFNSDLPLQVEE
jgi:hypothetical protein